MKYLKFTLALMFGVIALTGCLPKEETPQSTIDNEAMVAYLNANKISYTYDNYYGYYYNIVDSGKGVAITDSSQIGLRIKAYNLSNDTIQKDTAWVKTVNSLPISVRVGLTKVKIGGEINIYVPTYLWNGVQAAVINCRPKQSFKNQAAADDTLINEYLTSHHLTATLDTSGIYYNISAPGNSNQPTVDSLITVKYKGYLLSGVLFSSSVEGTPFKDKLSTFIKGWQRGIIKLGEGGKARFYIPSRLAFGTSEYAKIPANSAVIFDIELVQVQK